MTHLDTMVYHNFHGEILFCFLPFFLIFIFSLGEVARAQGRYGGIER